MIHFILFCCLSGVCLSVNVSQSPPDFIVKPQTEVKMKCNHERKDYRVMLWYQRSPNDTAMKLIGYLSYSDPNMEPGYESTFSIGGDLSGDQAKEGSLTIQVKGVEDSAVYYCVARGTGSGSSEAHFGGGTKLTVLETDRKPEPPKVKILSSSKVELPKTKRDQKKKTLVCVASEFYPDHVSVSWECSAGKCNEVATDNFPKWNGTYYRITSRLSILAETWEDPKNHFTCVVTFYDGNEYKDYPEVIYGVEGNSTINLRDNYMKIMQQAKLSYCVFIVKSCAYGVFVGFVMWKLQGSRRKR